MSEREKLLRKLLSHPKDFTFKEAESLLSKYGYSIDYKGKTSGSRVQFRGKVTTLHLHKPHNVNYLLPYQVRDVISFLETEGLIDD